MSARRARKIRTCDRRTRCGAGWAERADGQGRNPISDVFSLWALRQTVKYLPRVAKDPSDREALSAMLLGSTFAGIGPCSPS